MYTKTSIWDRIRIPLCRFYLINRFECLNEPGRFSGWNPEQDRGFTCILYGQWELCVCVLSIGPVEYVYIQFRSDESIISVFYRKCLHPLVLHFARYFKEFWYTFNFRYYACLSGYDDIVVYLLQAGAKYDQCNFSGERCMNCALTDRTRRILRNPPKRKTFQSTHFRETMALWVFSAHCVTFSFEYFREHLRIKILLSSINADVIKNVFLQYVQRGISELQWRMFGCWLGKLQDLCTQARSLQTKSILRSLLARS